MNLMKPLIYIAGPMTGKKDYNRAAFNAAARALAANGWQPINPVDIERIYPCIEKSGKTNQPRLLALMKIELEFVKRADAIYLLDGWETSEGTRGELMAFLDAGHSMIYTEANGTPNASWRD